MKRPMYRPTRPGKSSLWRGSGRAGAWSRYRKPCAMTGRRLRLCTRFPINFNHFVTFLQHFQDCCKKKAPGLTSPGPLCYPFCSDTIRAEHSLIVLYVNLARLRCPQASPRLGDCFRDYNDTISCGICQGPERKRWNLGFIFNLPARQRGPASARRPGSPGRLEARR